MYAVAQGASAQAVSRYMIGPAIVVHGFISWFRGGNCGLQSRPADFLALSNGRHLSLARSDNPATMPVWWQSSNELLLQSESRITWKLDQLARSDSRGSNTNRARIWSGICCGFDLIWSLLQIESGSSGLRMQPVQQRQQRGNHKYFLGENKKERKRERRQGFFVWRVSLKDFFLPIGTILAFRREKKRGYLFSSLVKFFYFSFHSEKEIFYVTVNIKAKDSKPCKIPIFCTGIIFMFLDFHLPSPVIIV